MVGTCVVHLIRTSLMCVSCIDREKDSAVPCPIHTTPDGEVASCTLGDFAVIRDVERRAPAVTTRREGGMGRLLPGSPTAPALGRPSTDSVDSLEHRLRGRSVAVAPGHLRTTHHLTGNHIVLHNSHSIDMDICLTASGTWHVHSHPEDHCEKTPVAVCPDRRGVTLGGIGVLAWFDDAFEAGMPLGRMRNGNLTGMSAKRTPGRSSV